MAPEHESMFSLQEPIRRFWSVEQQIWSAEQHS